MPWPTVNPGDLNCQIQIQSQALTPDAFGQPKAIWSTVMTCMGGFNLRSVREALNSGQLTSQGIDVWTVRWTTTTIQPGMQILYGSETFRIQAINNIDKRNVLLHILCLELNAPSGTGN